MRHLSQCFTLCLLLSACSAPESAVTPYSHVDGILSMGTRQDDTETERLLKSAADAGDDRALVNLGFLLGKESASERQEVNRERLVQAVKLYRVAASHGDSLALTNLGAICIGRLPSWAREVGACQSQTEALEWFRRAVEQGNTKALVYLGYMTERGFGGLEPNAVEAARLYQQAVERGEPLGAIFLSEMKRQPPIPLPSPDDAKSVELFQLATQQGDTLAGMNLGYMYERGLGGLPSDEQKTVRLYRLAADSGNPIALTNLAVMVAGGRGAPQDDREAVRLLKLAAHQGYPASQKYLAALYVAHRGDIEQDDTEAIHSLHATAERGEFWAMSRMAEIYELGEAGVNKDLEAAIRLNERMASEWGSTEAKTHLITLYEQRRIHGSDNSVPATSQ